MMARALGLLAVTSVYAFTHDESAACYASRYPYIRHFRHVPIVERLVEGACACKHPAYIRHFGHVPIVERLVEGLCVVILF